MSKSKQAEAPRLYLLTPRLADVGDFAPKLEAAMDTGDIACVLLRLATNDEGDAKKLIKALASMVQQRDCALLIDKPDIVARAGADGAHLRGTGPTLETAIEDAVESLRPDRIVGVGGVKTRHDAMVAGEQDIDYLMFGDPEPDGYTPPIEDTADWVDWWAQIFNVPCVGYAPRLADVGTLAAAGADFIAVGDCIWDDPRGPVAALDDATMAMNLAVRPA